MAAATLLPNTDCANSLGEATVNILENAFYLAKQKVELSRKAYKKLISYWGWENEDKKYLKVNQTFKKFSPEDLAQVEPATIFCLANQNKKYAPVIEKLLDRRDITQQVVRELMKQQRKPKPFLPEKPTIWRQTTDGRRYWQPGPNYDQETGVILQKLMDSTGKTPQQLLGEAVRLKLAMLEGSLVEVPRNEEIDVNKVETEESSFVHESSESEIGELAENNQPSAEIDRCETEVNENVSSSETISNPTTTQETVEFLSNELFNVVENINHFGRKEVKEAEKLIAQIIDFCNAQPVEEQWNTLALITLRNSKALMVVIGYSKKEHKDWLLNLPRLLANAVLENPEELDWVDKKLRSEALFIISNMTAFSATSQNV
ncbi:MAG: hypothetical protein AAF316_13785 [Cyanobacteria bacterium P01_A01_bin.80]